MKQYNSILLGKEAAVALICFNRPEQFNALSYQMLDELEAVIRDIANDKGIRAVVFTGQGKAFCAGVDLKDAGDIAKPIDSYWFLARLQSLFNKMANLEIPTIGAINGVALGGGFEMSLAFDFLIAAEHAKFGVPEINVGVLPGGGGMSRLPKKLGLSLAKRLVLLGENLTAAEAHHFGLVYKVVKSEDVVNEAKKVALVLAGKPQINVKLAKKVLEKSERMVTYDAMDYEAHAAALLYDTEDRKEGMQAFLEKRQPVFQGK